MSTLMSLSLHSINTKLLVSVAKITRWGKNIEQNVTFSDLSVLVWTWLMCRTPHQQIGLWGRLEMTSVLQLESRLPSRPTGTREWRCSDTRRCHWKHKHSLRHMTSCKSSRVYKEHTLTCPECRECSACRCVCLCALSKCRWTSCELLSSRRRSGPRWPPGSSSLRRAAGWTTNAPRTPGRLRNKQKDETRLSKAVLHFKVVIIFPHLHLLNEPKQGLNETVGNGLSFYKMPTCNPQIGRTRNITGNKLTDVGAVSLIDGRWR